MKVVTTVDEMSGGRIEVGVGAGWNAEDHRPLGLAVPPIQERADLMEDQLALLHGLWDEPDGWDFEGHQVSVEGGSAPEASIGPAAPCRERAPCVRGSSSAGKVRRGRSDSPPDMPMSST